MQIDFYKICQVGLEGTLVTLLNKSCNAGKKALILCPAPAAVAIDDALWSHDAVSWLPHGVDDADGMEHAPIWISTDMAANPIDAAFLFLLHGANQPSGTVSSAVFVYLTGARTHSLVRRDYNGRRGVICQI